MVRGCVDFSDNRGKTRWRGTRGTDQHTIHAWFSEERTDGPRIHTATIQTAEMICIFSPDDVCQDTADQTKDVTRVVWGGLWRSLARACANRPEGLVGNGAVRKR
jgi:hypothetical protein